jgi:hypothetical protein
MNARYPPIPPDYKKLKTILEQELNKSVSIEECKRIGDCLTNIYEVLMIDDFNDATIKTDTT